MSGTTIILKVCVVSWGREMEGLRKSECQPCALEILSEDVTPQLAKKGCVELSDLTKTWRNTSLEPILTHKQTAMSNGLPRLTSLPDSSGLWK